MSEKQTDHARGCQGREYTCTCGCDDQREWQPASTAPKDEMVLVCDVNWPASLQRDQPPPIKVGYLDTCSGAWRIFGASWRPTHFMPLPSPPKPLSTPSIQVAE